MNSITGNAPLIEEDEKFAVTQKELVDLLTRQLEVYDKEEHALRVLMEEEVKEKMHSRQTKGKQFACCMEGGGGGGLFIVAIAIMSMPVSRVILCPCNSGNPSPKL